MAFPRPRPAILALAALVAIQGGLLSRLFRPGMPTGEDLSIHLAEISGLLSAVRAGDTGLWNASANLGFASGYYYQILPQLLPVALVLVTGGALSLLTAFKIATALPLILLPVSTFRALRVLDAGEAESLGAAAAVGFVFSTSKWGLGPDGVFVEGLYTQPWGMLFYPLAFACAWRYLRRGQGLGGACAMSWLTGLCHPFVGVSLLPALLVTGWNRAGWRQGLQRAAVLLASVLAASAFFWVPILVHYDSFGGFPARVEGEGGILPAAFLRLVAGGNLLDAGRLPILTIGAVIAGVAIVRGRAPQLRPLVLQGLGFAFLVCVGPFVGKTPGDLIPPVRLLAPLQWSLAAASGATLAGLVLTAWNGGRRTQRIAAVLGTTVAAVLLLVGSHRALADRLRRAEDFPFLAIEELDTIIKALHGRPPGRFLADDTFGTGYHFWMYLPTAFGGPPALRAHGGAALQSSTHYGHLLAFDPGKQADLYGVKYVLVRRELGVHWSGAYVLSETAHHQLLELPGGGYFAPIAIVGALPKQRDARKAATELWLAGEGPSSGQHLARDDAGTATGIPVGRVEREWDAPSLYGADVSAPPQTSATFLLRVTYHPGWRARLDGVLAPIRRVTPDMMALDVPAGRHRIELTFRRPWWTWALLVTSLVFLAGLLAVSNVASVAVEK